MNSVFSFSELGSIFEDARADFSANFRAARAVRGLLARRLPRGA